MVWTRVHWTAVNWQVAVWFSVLSIYLWQVRQRCCPLPQSAGRHPEPRGRTCPSDPSAPACPRWPPWKTCFLLALDTTDHSQISGNTKAWKRQQQGAESRKEGALLWVGIIPHRYICISKWPHTSWMGFEMLKQVWLKNKNKKQINKLQKLCSFNMTSV